MPHAIIKNQDNSVAVVILSPEAEALYAKQGLNADQMAEAEATKLKSRGDLPATADIVAKNIPLPSNREFRGAWAWLTDKPEIDIDSVKAVEVTKNRLRAEREPLLAKLDLDYTRADEAGNNQAKSDIAKKKQLLRDVTATVPTPSKPIADEAFLNQLRGVKLPVVG